MKNTHQVVEEKTMKKVHISRLSELIELADDLLELVDRIMEEGDCLCGGNHVAADHRFDGISIGKLPKTIPCPRCGGVAVLTSCGHEDEE